MKKNQVRREPGRQKVFFKFKSRLFTRKIWMTSDDIQSVRLGDTTLTFSNFDEIYKSMDHFISGKLLNTNCQCCYITFFHMESTRHHFLLFIWNWIRAGCQKLVNLVCKLDSTNRSPLKRIGNFFVEKLLKCQQNIFGSIYILRILIGRMYACLRWESFFNEETLCAKKWERNEF